MGILLVSKAIILCVDYYPALPVKRYTVWRYLLQRNVKWVQCSQNLQKHWTCSIIWRCRAIGRQVQRQPFFFSVSATPKYKLVKHTVLCFGLINQPSRVPDHILQDIELIFKPSINHLKAQNPKWIGDS